MSGTCFECKFMRNRTDLEPCEHCTNTFAMTGVHPSFTPKKLPITNYDLLIRKTPEELAEWLSCNCTGDGYGNSAEDWIDWLRQATEL